MNQYDYEGCHCVMVCCFSVSFFFLFWQSRLLFFLVFYFLFLFFSTFFLPHDFITCVSLSVLPLIVLFCVPLPFYINSPCLPSSVSGCRSLSIAVDCEVFLLCLRQVQDQGLLSFSILFQLSVEVSRFKFLFTFHPWWHFLLHLYEFSKINCFLFPTLWSFVCIWVLPTLHVTHWHIANAPIDQAGLRRTQNAAGTF